MKRVLTVPAALAILIAASITGCSSTHAGPSILSLTGAAGMAGGGNSTSASPGASRSAQSRPRVGYSTSRVAQLHAAAQCIREPWRAELPGSGAHRGRAGVHRRAQHPGRRGQDGQAQQDALQNAIRQACGTLFTAAGLQPDDESPAPPQLVQAGVKASPVSARQRAAELPRSRTARRRSPRATDSA